MVEQNNKSLWVILFTIFMDLVGIGILIPVLPQLLANPESAGYLLPQGMSEQWGFILLGGLVAAYPLAQFFAAPILGQLSDRFGRRPILMISLFGTSLSYLLFALGIYTRNLPLLFVSRIFDGITGGNISVAQAAVADITKPENRSKNFGLMGAAFGLGFIIGPYIGGQLADSHVVWWFNATTPFLFAAFLSFINTLFIAFILRETYHGPSSAEPMHWGQSIKHIIKAFTDLRLRWIFLTGFFFQAGFSFFTTLFGVFLIKRFGFSQAATGNFFAYIGVCIVLTQVFITPRASKLWDERGILSVSFFGTAAALLCYLLPGPWTILLVITPFFAVFNGLVQANFTAFLSRSASRDVQGEVLGINASVSALSQAIPPAVAGVIAARTFTGSNILIASIVMIGAWILFITMVRHDPSSPEGQKMTVGH